MELHTLREGSEAFSLLPPASRKGNSVVSGHSPPVSQRHSVPLLTVVLVSLKEPCGRLQLRDAEENYQFLWGLCIP